MRDSVRTELLFSCVCLMLFSVDSLTWTVQPKNPTEAIAGQDVSLTWNYSFTPDELTKSQTFLLIGWKKFNPSSSAFVLVASHVEIEGQPGAAYNEPSAPYIVVDRATGTNFSSLLISNVRIEDGGIYKIEISVEFPGTSVVAADDEANLTVSVPPEIGYVSSDLDICEGSLVTLFCNATGIPTPSITWTRVADNGSDSAPLPVVDGTYVMSNITKSSKGTYRCTAGNGGGTVNRTVQVTVRYYPSVDRIVNSSNTVTEGGSFNMTCEASGDPVPTNYTWITVDTGQRHYGKVLVFPNINRSDTGQYRCEAGNWCGKGSRVQSVDRVLYKPEHVTLNVNISSNSVCAVTVVNFTCKAETANPEVHTYTLYENGSMVQNMERPGVWRKTLNTSGHYIYRCEANNAIGAVESNQRTLTVEVPASVLNVRNPINVMEGRNVTLSCDVSGFPLPNVSWVNTMNGEIMKLGTTWPLLNISRNYTGNYSCTASNACGNDSKATNINVQYSPSATSSGLVKNVELGKSFSYPCPVDGNPPPAITWYKGREPSLTPLSHGENLVLRVPQLSDSGWYTCFANSSLGSATVTVEIKVVVFLDVRLTLKVTNKDCNVPGDFSLVKRDFPQRVYQAYDKGKGLESVNINDARCGSIIVDLVLRFSQSVYESDVISTLKAAAVQEKFGLFKVDSDTIRITGPDPSPQSTTKATELSTKRPPCEETFIKDEKCKIKVMILVVIVIASVLVVVIVSGTAAWWVRRKRRY